MVPSTVEIERRKDLFDLAPTIKFVSDNSLRYSEGLAAFARLPRSFASQRLAERVKVTNKESCLGPQVAPEHIASLLSQVPETLAILSQLEQVSYHGSVPVPKFDSEGLWDGRSVDYVPFEEFPRSNDHPSRLLVGISTGTTIYPSPIPFSVSDNGFAIHMYQTHVFLHELGHTIFGPIQEGEVSSAIMQNGKRYFPLSEIVQEFEELCTSRGYEGVSDYSLVHLPNLTSEVKKKNPTKFDYSLREQICESLVGYFLGILPNDRGELSFRDAHPKEYELIKKVATSEVVE